MGLGVQLSEVCLFHIDLGVAPSPTPCKDDYCVALLLAALLAFRTSLLDDWEHLYSIGSRYVHTTVLYQYTKEAQAMYRSTDQR